MLYIVMSVTETISDIRSGQKTRQGLRIHRLHPAARAANPNAATVFEFGWRCLAGRFHSLHSSQQEAETSAQSCRGRHPYGKGVRVVQTVEEFFAI